MVRHFTFGTGRLPLAAVVASTLMAGLASADDKSTSGVEAFDPGTVWPVHITLSAEEFAAIQPRGGFGFGQPRKGPAKPADPARESHRSQFGADLAWGTGSVVVGDQKFEKVGIRYKGNGTIFDTARAIKKSFKIDLDRAGGAAGARRQGGGEPAGRGGRVRTPGRDVRPAAGTGCLH